MLKILAVVITIIASLGALVPLDAEAGRRFGGGGSSGMRRAVPPQQAPTARPDRQDQQSNAAGQRSGASRWLGPLMGFGLGALFMSMFGGSAFAGLLGNLLMFGLIFFAIRALMRMWQAKQGTLQPAGANNTSFRADGQSGSQFDVRGTGGNAHSRDMAPMNSPISAPRADAYPADFDANAFLRHAKVSFIRMQAANDAGDLNDIRDYTTPELYAEIAMQIQERAGAAQRTEVVKLDAELLEVVTEGERQIASVSYSGLIREDEGAAAQPFAEVWHVVKEARDPKAAWMIAGIQQV